MDVDIAREAEIVFLEGYLFDKDIGKEALISMARACRDAGGKAGIAIFDPFCVRRDHTDFLRFIENELDYVIGNEDEIKSFWTTDDLEAALAKTAVIFPLVACTRLGDGVTIIAGSERADVPIEKIVPVDATGACDGFAAGLLYVLALGHDLETCGRIGFTVAGEVIRHIALRAQRDQKEVLAAQNLI